MKKLKQIKLNEVFIIVWYVNNLESKVVMDVLWDNDFIVTTDPEDQQTKFMVEATCETASQVYQIFNTKRTEQ